MTFFTPNGKVFRDFLAIKASTGEFSLLEACFEAGKMVAVTAGQLYDSSVLVTTAAFIVVVFRFTPGWYLRFFRVFLPLLEAVQTLDEEVARSEYKDEYSDGQDYIVKWVTYSEDSVDGLALLLQELVILRALVHLEDVSAATLSVATALLQLYLNGIATLGIDSDGDTMRLPTIFKLIAHLTRNDSPLSCEDGTAIKGYHTLGV